MAIIDTNYPLSKETSMLIGIAMEVHRILGRGFSEIVYKDALQYEFVSREIFYEREKEYLVQYKNIILPHKFFADFVVFGEVLLEIKAQLGIEEKFYNQVINYLAVSKCKVALLLNFGEDSLKFKRIVL